MTGKDGVLTEAPCLCVQISRQMHKQGQGGQRRRFTAEDPRSQGGDSGARRPEGGDLLLGKAPLGADDDG